MWTRIYFSWAVPGTPPEQQKESEPHCKRKMSLQTHISQSNKQKPYELLSIAKNLFSFQKMLTKITLGMIPTPFQNVHTVMQCLAASSKYNFRVGFSKMLYVGLISILMKTMENFNGVHTWLMWKAFERLYISSLSALYCGWPSFEHTDTLSQVQKSFIPFGCWLWTPKRS